jgi:putative ABC transport system permease protein
VKYDGNYAATLLARNEGDIDKIKAEAQEVASRPEMIDPARYSKARIITDTSMEKFARSIGPGKELVMSIIVSFMILFMLIPAVNLVNVNISRIIDRASEIGIRKAFGASSKRLILQFVVENIMITLFGGLISLVMAGIALQLLKGMNFVPVTANLINWRVFLLSILTTLFFGLLSGVYPAYKMSRMNVVDALKN